MKRIALLAAAGGLLASLLPGAALAAAEIRVAVADFVYLDTSGEPRDQAAEHLVRLDLFRERIESDLGDTGRFSVVQLSCGSDACSAETVAPDALAAAAAAAGADYLVFGGIHKMSSLVQNGKVDVLALGDGKIVMSRKISFRGDTDTAFDRAGAFIAREMNGLAALTQ